MTTLFVDRIYVVWVGKLAEPHPTIPNFFQKSNMSSMEPIFNYPLP